TLWPAFGSFQEDIKGSLEVGKFADLTVFSEDIMTIKAEDILNTENLMTIVGGRIVYKKLQKKAP
ncbi:MAG: amidohydrolase family protein, partial [SAR86 cluster bacterium]|nr:amidohydrolase family protein [SAR86 cluster bacterium]